jgi:ADP-heptose:LPS heptosyltransferase
MPGFDPPFRTIGVIVGGDLVGDALIKLPFLRALRAAFPKAEINWITDGFSTAFGTSLRAVSAALIDKVYITSGWPHPGGADVPASFDLLIDTRNSRKKALEARKVPHRLFLASAMRFLFSDRRPSLFRARPAHLADRLLQFVELAAGYMPPSEGVLPVPEELLEKARRILPDGPVYVGLAPGCTTPIRTWPRERFVEIAKTQSSKGRVPVFILGPQETGWFEELRALVPAAKFPLQELDAWGAKQLTLDHSFALGSRLSLIVANDSGPGHIFAAAGCPVVSVFGPTTPTKASPRAQKGVAVCARDFGSTEIEAVPWEAVDRAVDRLLAMDGVTRRAG